MRSWMTMFWKKECFAVFSKSSHSVAFLVLPVARHDIDVALPNRRKHFDLVLGLPHGHTGVSVAVVSRKSVCCGPQVCHMCGTMLWLLLLAGEFFCFAPKICHCGSMQFTRKSPGKVFLKMLFWMCFMMPHCAFQLSTTTQSPRWLINHRLVCIETTHMELQVAWQCSTTSRNSKQAMIKQSPNWIKWKHNEWLKQLHRQNCQI